MGANGVTPRTNLCLELLLMPLMPLIQAGFLWYADRTVRSHAARRNATAAGAATASGAGASGAAAAGGEQ